ncbi:phage tail tape measure protein [Salmonella enterica]|uniref:Phage tail tape measure protein n=1 Tax=Salmonella enterica subsp. diarizonae serovar 48:i:z TaxID=1192842 RepID=A0A7U5YFF4_SALDZ|nr:phage tail tape measure protein [Salmonella enterica]EAA4450036.1 phage tail tape measure protein [Salmonella enterica subsp. diarizonae]EDW6119453.1 phage tail tape measure protein [Salmonella enterica subsp. salamae]AXC71945.1 phage tail tape measure protein [Salmonella enterica subsp. diarizonae serovar 48:i:z]EAM2671784.1 phage tail tape measure protein [Salmonella enterica]EAM6407771.1 phage tail tape measure protein [Salmonella enterica]
MDQVANLVFDLGMDSQKFRDEMPRVVKILQNASGESARAEARLKRFIESQNKASQEATAGAEAAVSAEGRQRQAVALTAQSYAQMSQRVDLTQRHIAALNQKLQGETAKAAAVAQAQDAAAAAFYRQIDSVKQLSGGLQELQAIQAQVRQAKGRGDISQGDYLALVSETAAKTRELTDAEALAMQKKAQFIRSLKEQAAAQNLSRTELLRVKAAELGVSNAADVYIRKLDTAAKSTHALGLKSAMARREIGVLIGELARGNFGALRGSGITLANRAGWLETLMSPKGLMIGGVVGGIAAAVYGLGKAFYEGEKEGEEFNKQLILTGNYAGKTAGQLNEMAKSLAGNGITQHDAAGVLAQVVGSGAFRGGQVETVARAAAKMQEAVGQSVDKTIADFRKLYDEPTKASEELNNQMHYLTASQFQYISALESRGDKEAAGQYAADKYSEAEQQRSQQIIDNLGIIERAIRSATNRWKEFWDAALNIGRPKTEQYQLDQVNQAINQIYEDRKKSGKSDLFDTGLQKLLEQKKGLEFVIKSQQGYADAQQHLQDVNEEGIKAQIVANKYYSAGLTNAEKRVIVEKEINKAIKANADAAKITQNLSKDKRVEKWSDDYIAKIRAGVEKLYKDPKPHKATAYHNDEASRLLLQYSQQQAQVEGQIAAAKLSTTEKMTEAHKQLLAFQQRIADLSGKKLTEDEQSLMAHKDEIALALQKLDIAQQDLQHQNAINELKKKTVQLTSQLAEEETKVRQQHTMSLATMGMGDQQRGRYEERLKIQQQYQDKLEQLKRDSKAKGTYGSDEYRQAEQELQDSLDRRLVEWADYNAKVDASQGDWTQGASRALDNFLAQGSNVAGMTENVFTNAFNGMADGIANFALTGKMDFRSFTVSILSDLAKMEARIAASKLLGSVLGMFGFGASAGGSTPSGAYNSAALSVIPNADGGVYRSAGLSQYSGSIVDRPTFFQFARGAAVMGEAGPEAILPLRRGTDGKLGVVAAGSGGMAMFAPQYHIAISNTGPELTPQALKAVYDLGKKAAADFVQQQGRDGGRLSGAYR